MQPGKFRSRSLLLVGVSLAAICVAMPETGRAADMAPAFIAKAPPVLPAPDWTFFVEGGGFWTSGGRHHVPFLTSLADPEGFVGFAPKFGFSIAAGFDYRAPLSPWHVSGQFRYSRAGENRHSANFETMLTFPFSIGAAGSSRASAREQHWVADFAIGRDLGLGTESQIKLGLRVAELRARSRSAFDMEVFAGTVIPTGSLSYRQNEKHRFLGFGPRLAIEGSAPLGGNWSLDYAAGGAALFGKRKIDFVGQYVFDDGVDPESVRFSDSASDSAVVWNADASLALAYRFSPHTKLAVGYRFDGYFNALKVVSSAPRLENVDRLFHGPFVRATGSF